MQLPAGFDAVKETEFSGGFKKPEAKGYIFGVYKVVDTVSGNNNPQMVFYLDIVEGEHKGAFSGDNGRYWKRLYQTYHSVEGQGRLKAIFNTFVKENPSKFMEGEVISGDFDEQRLRGCRIGGVLRYNQDGYLNMSYLTTIEKALEAEVQPAPAQKPTPTTTTAYGNPPMETGDLLF